MQPRVQTTSSGPGKCWCMKKQVLSLDLHCSNYWFFLNFIFMVHVVIWAVTRQDVSSGVSGHARHKPACAATEASMRLEILVTETRSITLSKQRTTKALIRLHGCAGWSAPLLFAYDMTHFLMARLIYLCHVVKHINGKNYRNCDNQPFHIFPETVGLFRSEILLKWQKMLKQIIRVTILSKIFFRAAVKIC